MQSNLSKQNILSVRDAFSQTSDIETKKYAAQDSYHSQDNLKSLHSNSKHRDERNTVRVNGNALISNFEFEYNVICTAICRLLHLAVIWLRRPSFRRHLQQLQNLYRKNHRERSILMFIVRAQIWKMTQVVVRIQLMAQTLLNWNQIQRHKPFMTRIN